MAKKEILIYDDDPAAVEQWKRKLEALAPVGRYFDVTPLDGKDFERAVSGLRERRRQAREEGPLANPEWNNRFDKVAIFVIDFDLFDANSPSGEEIAYLVRCYSRCGLIVALNQFDKAYSAFDLTLQGHPESFADLNIGDPLLDNPGLWLEPWEGFRPWAWPLLPHALEQFERRVRKLRGNLEKPILGYLGLQEPIARSLPRSTVEFLTKSDDPMETTFDNFVRKSGNGLRGRDEPYCEETLVRVAAARITHWLECLVLPGQNVLVDAPHSVSRYPSLLGERSGDQEAWNRTASFGKHDELGLDPVIHEYRFMKSDWLSRPAWFWSEVSNCSEIREVANPWSVAWPDWVFCEDVSRFLSREATREFVADLPSQFVRRFVVNAETPEGKKYIKDPEKITYKPKIRFSL